MARGFSCHVTCGIFLDQQSNPCSLCWQADSDPLYHQGICILSFDRYRLAQRIPVPVEVPNGHPCAQGLRPLPSAHPSQLLASSYHFPSSCHLPLSGNSMHFSRTKLRVSLGRMRGTRGEMRNERNERETSGGGTGPAFQEPSFSYGKRKQHSRWLRFNTDAIKNI